MSVRVRVVALAALVALSSCRASDGERGFRFTPVDTGIEYARFFVPARGEDEAFDGHAFRVRLDESELRVLSAGGPTTRRDVETIVRALPRVVASNASFFAEDGRAMGLVVDQGTLRGRRRIKTWSALVIDEGGARVVDGKDVDLKARPHLVVQGQPRLVDGGRPQSVKPQRARRTVACLTGEPGADERYDTLVLVVTSEVDAAVLARVLAEPVERGGLACESALNLDGGPSTQLVARLGDFSVAVKGGDGVPNALAIVPGRSARVSLTAQGDAGVVEEEAASSPLDDTTASPAAP